MGPSQWDAVTGQLLPDFKVAEIRATWCSSTLAPARHNGERHAEEWYNPGEQLGTSDRNGAEQACRKAIEISPLPYYAAYVDLGALLRELEARCNDALLLFDEAFVHFLDDAVLHFNRAVALKELGRFDDAVDGYQGAGIAE
ncbi:hypothetical protein PPGU19_071890 (plasmid) [Paraburkholderia sp. PGU19]|nr:hypothetical protein PPGU19_071890 [Paraburkholderia sp. PGU19]